MDAFFDWRDEPERENNEEGRERFAQDENRERGECGRELLTEGVIGRARDDEDAQGDPPNSLRLEGFSANPDERPVSELDLKQS